MGWELKENSIAFSKNIVDLHSGHTIQKKSPRQKPKGAYQAEMTSDYKSQLYVNPRAKIFLPDTNTRSSQLIAEIVGLNQDDPRWHLKQLYATTADKKRYDIMSWDTDFALAKANQELGEPTVYLHMPREHRGRLRHQETIHEELFTPALFRHLEALIETIPGASNVHDWAYIIKDKLGI